MEKIIRQAWYFGAAFLWGCVLMFFYDFLLIFRCKVRHGRFLTLVEDWFFWGISAILVFQMIFFLNYGIMRSFFVVSFTVGMAVYKKVVKDRFVRLVLAGIRLVLRPFVWFYKKISGKRKKSLK